MVSQFSLRTNESPLVFVFFFGGGGLKVLTRIDALFTTPRTRVGRNNQKNAEKQATGGFLVGLII